MTRDEKLEIIKAARDLSALSFFGAIDAPDASEEERNVLLLMAANAATVMQAFSIDLD